MSCFVLFCPVLSCFVPFCPVFVCNWLRLRCCFADERVLSHELWVGYRLASQTTSPQDHETTSGSRPTSCLVVLAQPSKKLRRLVSTSVRHHSSIPLKYSPLGGIRGDTVVRRGWQCRSLVLRTTDICQRTLCSAYASQTTSLQDNETTSGYRLMFCRQRELRRRKSLEPWVLSRLAPDCCLLSVVRCL